MGFNSGFKGLKTRYKKAALSVRSFAQRPLKLWRWSGRN